MTLVTRTTAGLLALAATALITLASAAPVPSSYTVAVVQRA